MDGWKPFVRRGPVAIGLVAGRGQKRGPCAIIGCSDPDTNGGQWNWLPPSATDRESSRGWMEVGVGPVRLGLLSLRLIVKMSRPSAWQIICHAGQLYTAEAHVTQR